MPYWHNDCLYVVGVPGGVQVHREFDNGLEIQLVVTFEVPNVPRGNACTANLAGRDVDPAQQPPDRIVGQELAGVFVQLIPVFPQQGIDRRGDGAAIGMAEGDDEPKWLPTGKRTAQPLLARRCGAAAHRAAKEWIA